MNKNKREKINNYAFEIRKNSGLKTPITIESLKNFIKKLNGKLSFDEINLSSDTDGKIEKTNNNEFRITINSNNFSSEDRQKFTIAHELGHLFLHMHFLEEEWNCIEDYQDSIYERKGYSQEEYEAHEFAAAILMPKDEFKMVVEKYTKDNKCNTAKLAAHFLVSKDAAINRGKWLGVFEW